MRPPTPSLASTPTPCRWCWRFVHLVCALVVLGCLIHLTHGITWIFPSNTTWSVSISGHSFTWEIPTTHTFENYDLDTFLDGAAYLSVGESPYQNPRNLPLGPLYCYPMTLGLMLIPLYRICGADFLAPGASGATPLWPARWIWLLIQLFCLGYGLWLVMRDARARGLIRIDRWGVPILTVLFLLSWDVIQSNIWHAQPNPQILFLCVLFFLFEERKRSYLAGMCLGLAFAIKLLPGVLFFYLVMRKSWRTLAVSIVSVAAFCLVPMLWMGWEVVDIYRNEYIQGVIALRSGGDYFDRSPHTLHHALSWFYQPLYYSSLFKYGCAAAVMAVCMFVGWRARNRWGQAAPYVFSLFLLSICLVMPYSQKHYLVFLFPGIVLAALRARTLTDRPRRRITAWLVIFHILYWPGLWLKDYPVYFLSIATLAALMIHLTFSADGSDDAIVDDSGTTAASDTAPMPQGHGSSDSQTSMQDATGTPSRACATCTPPAS